jgi:Fe-S-cluster containining protein
MECKRCGKCCEGVELVGTIQATKEDLIRWKKEGRKDILKHVFISSKGKETTGDKISLNEIKNLILRTDFKNNPEFIEGDFADFCGTKDFIICPFLKKPNICKIQDTKPEVCKNYFCDSLKEISL